jgi:hypothetical protein
MNVTKMTMLAAAAIVAVALGAAPAAAQSHTSKPFAGAKVNGGTVTHSVQNGKQVLTLSDDFQVPDTPDPHWQIVDSKGQVFLLQRLKAKGAVAGLAGDRLNKSITLPDYIKGIAKVQIYCAWAEAVLGETTFEMTTGADTAAARR